MREKEITEVPKRVLLWHANYHPDGGQLFFPLDSTPYVVQLATKARFYDAQGSVLARVSVNFPNEFGVFLEIPLKGI